MNIVVVKFGGTSVATEEGRAKAISHIDSLRAEGKNIVAVVSAMGRKGAPYATDTLISLLNKNSRQDNSDLLVSCGEVISACVFADDLMCYGIDAVAITGGQAGIVTNGVFGKAEIFDIDTKRIKAELYEGKIVVVAGFQGVSVRNEVTTLGRGGSDTSAVMLGGFLNAEAVHIFTDVPGIAVIDPRIVPEAKFMENVDMKHMYILAHWGAGVIHPRAVAEAQKYDFDLFVRSTFDDSPGTKLVKNLKSAPGLVGIAVMRECDIFEPEESDDLIVERGKVKKAVRPSCGSTYSLLTAVFNRCSENYIKNVIGDLPDKTQCFFHQHCIHIFIESKWIERIAGELHKSLLENTVFNG